MQNWTDTALRKHIGGSRVVDDRYSTDLRWIFVTDLNLALGLVQLLVEK